MAQPSAVSVVEHAALLAPIRAVLFDMDGVLYRGSTPLPGVNTLWRWLEQRGIAYALLTNNASRTQQQAAAHMETLGLPVAPERIISAALATGVWLRTQAPPGTLVHCLGMAGLREALFGDGYFVEHTGETGRPDYVVVGVDFEATYAKLRAATFAIRQGAHFIGTNPDRTFPTEGGLAPGCGALLAALEAATDVRPIVIGKPERALFDTALHLLGTTAAQTLMVGDRLDTDIAGAAGAGLPTALVLTGVSTATEAQHFTPAPDMVVQDLPALLAIWQEATA